MRAIETMGPGVVAALLTVAVAACSGGGASEMEMVTVPSGTELTVQLDQEMSTKSHSQGDEFTAHTAAAVNVGGAAAIPAGSVVRGVVTGVQRADSEGKKGVLKLDFRTVEVRGQSSDLSARVVAANPETRSTSSTAEDAAKVGGAAAAGAILGRVIGGDGTGAAVGAAVGAAAGTGIVLATKDGYAVLPEGSNLRLRTTEPTTVPVSLPEAGSGGGA